MTPSTIGIYWFHTMPITPPDPGKILEALRTVEEHLYALAALHPHDVLPRVAIGAVQVAVTAVKAIVDRDKPAE